MALLDTLTDIPFRDNMVDMEVVDILVGTKYPRSRQDMVSGDNL